MSFLMSFVLIVGSLIVLNVSHSEILPGFIGPIYPFLLSMAVTIRLDREIRRDIQPKRTAAAWRGR